MRSYQRLSLHAAPVDRRHLRATGVSTTGFVSCRLADLGCMFIHDGFAPETHYFAAAMAFAVVVRPCSAYRRLATSMLAVLRGCEPTGLSTRYRSDGLQCLI
jgi:hypothetical protein